MISKQFLDRQAASIRSEIEVDEVDEAIKRLFRCYLDRAIRDCFSPARYMIAKKDRAAARQFLMGKLHDAALPLDLVLETLQIPNERFKAKMKNLILGLEPLDVSWFKLRGPTAAYTSLLEQ